MMLEALVVVSIEAKIKDSRYRWSGCLMKAGGWVCFLSWNNREGQREA